MCFADILYFLVARMISFFIGRTIQEVSVSGALYIAMTCVYGLFILLCLIRLFYKYHHKTLDESIYPAPLYLYTMLAPLTMLGLPFMDSGGMIVLIYCIQFGLLILIIILSRDFTIFTKPNVIFYLTELIFIGFNIIFILLDDTSRSYIILTYFLVFIIITMVEVVIQYHGGIDFTSIKVHPE